MPKPTDTPAVPSEEVAPDIHIDQQSIERSEKVLDNLFGGDREDDESNPEVTPPPAKKKAEAKPPAPYEEEEEEEEEEPTSDTDDSEEEDWDSEKPTPDDDDEEDPPNESAARQQAKLKGREAKELKAQLTETKLEKERIQKERDELQARLEEVEATRIRPEDHPDFVELRDGILADVSQAAELLPVPEPDSVVQNFGPFMQEYLKFDALKGTERAAARTALKGLIVDKLNLSEIPYDELDDDERKAFDGTTTEVLKIIQRNVGKTKELQKLDADLANKARTGQLSVGVRAYESTVGEFKPIFDSIGDLADDVIEANPHAVESVVAKLVKESPEAKRRLEKAKADVLETIVGPRALTQSEIDKLEANGTDVKQFLAERAKAHRAKQKKLAVFFTQGLMTRSLLKDALAKVAKYEADNEAESSEFDALAKATKKRAAPVEKETRPKDRPSAITKLFPNSED